jgi:hypothetical protein
MVHHPKTIPLLVYYTIMFIDITLVDAFPNLVPGDAAINTGLPAPLMGNEGYELSE